jgi:hypothetical protein
MDCVGACFSTIKEHKLMVCSFASGLPNKLQLKVIGIMYVLLGHYYLFIYLLR